MFEGLLVNLLIFMLSLFVLIKSSHLTITNAVNVADAFGIGKTTIGFILLSFSTTLPELLVSIFSSLQGTVGLAIGNVLGSNIVNICFILGFCIIMSTLSKTRNCIDLTSCIAEEEIGSLYFGLFVGSIIPLILIYVKEVSRFVGVILITIFLFNTYFLTKKRASIHEEASEKGKKNILKQFLFLFMGVSGVVGSSYFLVDTATNIALLLGVPNVVIGATIVAFGTSVPELATGIQASRLGHLNMVIGHLIGSGFINLTLILGTTLIFSAFLVNIAAFSELAIFSLIANLFLWYFISSGKIGVKEGIILVGLYTLYLITSFGSYRP